jgi:hypothetical protein
MGYAHNQKIFMKPGDIITILAERTDTLSNPVVAIGGG